MYSHMFLFSFISLAQGDISVQILLRVTSGLCILDTAAGLVLQKHTTDPFLPLLKMFVSPTDCERSGSPVLQRFHRVRSLQCPAACCPHTLLASLPWQHLFCLSTVFSHLFSKYLFLFPFTQLLNPQNIQTVSVLLLFLEMSSYSLYKK